MLKIARLARLRSRLGEALGDDPELAGHFERALTHHDEQALGRAFERLQAGPEEVRRLVEQVILDWLFGSEGELDVAHLMPECPNGTRH